MRSIEIVRNKGELERETWRFFYMDREHALVLNSWTPEARESKRHKFRACDGAYSAYARRAGDRKAPAIPDDVACEAIAFFTQSLRVMTFDEFPRGGSIR